MPCRWRCPCRGRRDASGRGRDPGSGGNGWRRGGRRGHGSRGGRRGVVRGLRLVAERDAGRRIVRRGRLQARSTGRCHGTVLARRRRTDRLGAGSTRSGGRGAAERAADARARGRRRGAAPLGCSGTSTYWLRSGPGGGRGRARGRGRGPARLVRHVDILAAGRTGGSRGSGPDRGGAGVDVDEVAAAGGRIGHVDILAAGRRQVGRTGGALLAPACGGGASTTGGTARWAPMVGRSGLRMSPAGGLTPGVHFWARTNEPAGGRAAGPAPGRSGTAAAQPSAAGGRQASVATPAPSSVAGKRFGLGATVFLTPSRKAGAGIQGLCGRRRARYFISRFRSRISSATVSLELRSVTSVLTSWLACLR